MTDVDFTEMEYVLSAAGAAISVPEAHGSLCGHLCGVPDTGAQVRIDQVLSDVDTANAQSTVAGKNLENMYLQTRPALLEGQMKLVLMLPRDVDNLQRRAEALTHWCQGFLFGLGTAGFTDIIVLPETVREIIGDFTEITRAALDDSEDDEESEKAYVELVEFARVSTQLAFEELAEFRVARGDPGKGLH